MVVHSCNDDHPWQSQSMKKRFNVGLFSETDLQFVIPVWMSVPDFKVTAGRQTGKAIYVEKLN